MTRRVREPRANTRSPAPIYSDDLAHIQHVGFADFARRASRPLLAMLRAAGIRRGHVVDLGCGDGTWLRRLTDAGYTATGIDRSRALVRLARSVAPAATLRVASVHDGDLPHCDAITAIGEVFNYLENERAGPPSLSAIFRHVHAALSPGGLFVFDLLVAGAGAPMAYRGWREGEGWTVLIDVDEDLDRRRLTREIVTFRRVGRAHRRHRERHVLRVPLRSEIVTALERAGFTVRVARRYGDVELLPRRLAFIARKKSATRSPRITSRPARAPRASRPGSPA
jgi:SAM-dependent methyltransferase